MIRTRLAIVLCLSGLGLLSGCSGVPLRTRMQNFFNPCATDCCDDGGMGVPLDAYGGGVIDGAPVNGGIFGAPINGSCNGCAPGGGPINDVYSFPPNGHPVVLPRPGAQVITPVPAPIAPPAVTPSVTETPRLSPIPQRAQTFPYNPKAGL